MNRIPINRPSITSLEIDYVHDAIANGWGDQCYMYINKFEQLFCDYQKRKYGVATSSCTGAIHLALLALGIKPGDEVIVPEITWVATVEPILYIGAKPIFVDVLPDTWCIDPQKIKSAITSKTKAIIPVHVYGNLCEMNEIMQIASEHDLYVIEDAAEALGSEYYGKKAGSIGHIGVFSFHGTKTMSTGEGGILVTDDEDLSHKVRVLNDHGRDARDPEHKTFWMRNYGYKYKMSNLQAAMGCAQMERIVDLITRKREIFNKYRSFVEKYNLPFSLNPEYDNTTNSYWLPTIIVNKDYQFDREDFIRKASIHKIDIRPFFYPLSSLPFFDKKESDVAFSIYKRGFNVPSFHDIQAEEFDRIFYFFLNYFNGSI